MERIYDTVRGYAKVRVTGAEPAAFLDLCLKEGVRFWAVCPEDQFTLWLTMDLRASERAGALAEKCFCQAEITRRGGGPPALKKLKRRAALLCFGALLFALLTFSTFFVLRIDVEGNETVGTARILNALEDNGVYIGSYWPAFNSEIIRSHMLEDIPELKWVSVSLFGSRVHIEVREREEPPELFDEDLACNVVASRDGLVESVSVLRGEGSVEPGDTVARGDMLIEGQVISPRAGARYVHASGSVKARTWYELTAIVPMEYTEKVPTGGEKKRLALEIGKRRINFYGNSGICGTMCDNIIERRTAGAQGLFYLPVSLVTITSQEYETRAATLTEEQARQRLEQLLREELAARLGDSGELVDSSFTFELSEGFGVGTLRAECLEDIAEEVEIPAGEQAGAEQQS